MADYTFGNLLGSYYGTDSINSYSYIPISKSIVTQGLVLHLSSNDDLSYQGSESTWKDLTSNNNDATFTGTYSYDGNFLTFADSGYATISNNSDFTFNDDFTLECRINLIGTPDNTFPSAILSSWDATGDPDNKFILFVSSSGQLVLQLNGEANTFIYPTEIQLNQWYHITISRLNNEVSMYVNASKYVASSNYPNQIQPTLDIMIGSYYGSIGQSFEGKIQMVRVYKNKGLTESEVENNYREFYIEPSDGTINVGNLNIGSSATAVPGVLTGRRPTTGQVFPRGVYNK
jgi:hypothetical protein